MKKSLKAALLSGLVFPGAGYFAVQRAGRAVSFLLVAGGCTAYLLNLALCTASLIVDKALAGEAPMDPASIERLAAASAPGAGAAGVASYVLLACWVVSIVDGYRIGRQLDAAEAVVDASPAPPRR